MPERTRFPFPENLLRRLEVQTNGCVYYTGYRDPHGYGRVYCGSEKVPAHRAMWELMVGPIPDGYQVDHLCRNPPCVNLAHLEPVTQRENILRGIGPTAVNARKTHCSEGHPYNQMNNRGERICGICTAARKRRDYHEAKGASA